MSHSESGRLFQKEETCRQGDAADFVEAWYSDLLATAAASLNERKKQPGGEVDTAEVDRLQGLLEIVRGDLQHGFRYQDVIDFACNLEESEVQLLMAKVKSCCLMFCPAAV